MVLTVRLGTNLRHTLNARQSDARSQLVKATDLDFLQVRFLLGAVCMEDVHQMRSSREKPGALLSSFATQDPLHTTTEAQFKYLLRSRVIGGGHVHVTFIVGNVRKRLAI